MTTKAKAKGEAVDWALAIVAKRKSEITINVKFLKNWAMKAREFGGALSEERVSKAFRKMKISIISISDGARRMMRSFKWNALLATL